MTKFQAIGRIITLFNNRSGFLRFSQIDIIRDTVTKQLFTEKTLINIFDLLVTSSFIITPYLFICDTHRKVGSFLAQCVGCPNGLLFTQLNLPFVVYISINGKQTMV